MGSRGILTVASVESQKARVAVLHPGLFIAHFFHMVWRSSFKDSEFIGLKFSTCMFSLSRNNFKSVSTSAEETVRCYISLQR